MNFKNYNTIFISALLALSMSACNVVVQEESEQAKSDSSVNELSSISL